MHSLITTQAVSGRLYPLFGYFLGRAWGTQSVLTCLHVLTAISRCKGLGSGCFPPKSTVHPHCAVQAERLDLLGMLQQLPLKIRTEEQEAILQGLSRAEMGRSSTAFFPR